MTRLFIEDQELDISQDISHQLTYAIDDLTNIDSKSTSFSKTIIIPGTANNNALFGNIFELSNANFYDPANPNVFYDFNAARSSKARIEINGLQAMKGVMRLLGIVVDGTNVEYEVALFGELGGFVASIGNKKLEDIDFSGYDQDWNATNITDSWVYDEFNVVHDYVIFQNVSQTILIKGTTTIDCVNIGDKVLIEGSTSNDGVYNILRKTFISGVNYLILYTAETLTFEINNPSTTTITRIRGNRGGGVVFPLIDYGQVSTGKIDFDFSTFRPALFVKEYIDKIIESAGYTYTSNFFNTTFFKNLIVPTNTDKVYKYDSTNYLDVSSSDYTFNWYRQDIVNPSGNNWIQFDDYLPFEDINNLNQFTDLTNRYRADVTSSRSVRVKLNLKLKYTHNTIYQYPPASPPFAANLPRFYISFERGNPSFNTSEVLFRQNLYTTGQHIYEVNFQTDITINNEDVFNVRLWFDYYYSGTNTLTTKYDIDYEILESSFTIDQYPSGYIPLNYDETLRINDYIPKNIFQKDFFTSVMKLFNLMVFERKDKTKHLMIEPNAYFYNTKPESFLDWSYKMNRAKPVQIKPMSEINARYYNFKYKDDNDFYNDRYKKKYNETYGNRLYDNRLDFAKDDNNTEIIFSPSPLVGYKTDENNIDKVMVCLFKKNGDNEEQTPTNIRILQIKHITDVYQWNILVNNASVVELTDYLYAGHFDDPNNPQIDINYGATNELYYPAPIGGTGNNAFNMFYSPYMAEITDKDSKLLTAEFYLDEIDIFQLDFSRYILIDGVLFRLVKIMDWVAGELCKVQLLKVINTTYIPDGDVNAGRPIGDNPRERYWSSENYMGRYFNNGDIIPIANSEEEAVAFSKAKEPFCCWYNFDSVNYWQYGMLYSIDAINDERGIAPTGYRIPTEDDYLQLIRYVAGDPNATTCDSEPLQEIGTDRWNTGGSDDYGFTSVGGGYAMVNKTSETITFADIKEFANLWSQTQFNISTLKYQYYLENKDASTTEMKNVQIGDSNQFLFNVRFVKEI